MSTAIAESVPPHLDPFLSETPASTRRQVEAGLMFAGYAVESRLEDTERAARYLQRYKSLLSETGRRD